MVINILQRFPSLFATLIMLAAVFPVRSTAPAAPSDLRVGGFPGGRIHISWTDNASDEPVFELERSINDRLGYELLTILDANTTEFNDTNVFPDTTYWYRVRACNGELCSTYSKDSFNVSFTAGSVPNLDEQYALFLINEARADPGAFGYPSYSPVPPVAYNELLNYAAHSHSQAILNSDFNIGHCYPDPPSSQPDTEYRCPSERARDVGYIGGVGENLIAGDHGWHATEGAHQAFMDSEGHRNNLLFSGFTQAGLGHSYDPNKGSVFHGQYTQTFCGWHQVTIPALPSGIVVPYWGREATAFTFLVNFYNIDGTAPNQALVVIDGVAKSMILRNGTAFNGSYAYSTNLTKGSHTYYFYFRYNDDQIARLPESGSFSGPDVEVGAAVLEVPGEYPTLAKALAYARGDVIVQISEGIFYETTPIGIPSSGIWVQGAGMDKTIIRGDGSGHVLEASVDSVIRDLTITGGGPTDYFESGIWNTSGHVDIRNVRITGNNVGIFSWCFSEDCDAVVTVTNSIIDNNSRVGIDANEYPVHHLVNNTIFGNGTGLFLSNSASRVENNIIVKNQQAGVFNNHQSPTIQYNDVWGNGDNFVNLSPGLGDIRMDPRFQDEALANYRLRSDSPCIDAGNPSSEYNDRDESRNDQGAYGGPNASLDLFSRVSSPRFSFGPFLVSWEGSATYGIQGFDVQYQAGAGNQWNDWLINIAETSAIFGPEDPVYIVPGLRYCFRTQLRDNLGNIEGYPEEVVACTDVLHATDQVFLPILLKP